ncbi:DNA repair protein endonuclease SAE2/CtIP C-terminus-domain-containing protein [Dendryphion nanum]|uniref:DNA repair protein endonuclease SAE2/CtIP C-terminus-domain-containing protein n=1 Tax=Dendryphion nanum TaxID=256645 RepID=A0A9P9IDR5_9PLEO|nr:DNA repair protein endonuclease SAE2/CtIP C-terminus-domain-containing protein [Dendryphion nanum]
MAETRSWLEQQKSLWKRELSALERVSNEVIENTAKELKKQDEEHRNALHDREEQYRIISSRISEEVIKNSRLIERNSYLTYRLQKVDSKFFLTDSALDIDTNAASDSNHNPTVATGEYRHLVDKYNELHKLYQENLNKIKYLERKNAAVMQKNKEMKESVLAWQQFSERHRERQKFKSEEKAKMETPRPGGLHVEDAPPLVPSSPRSSTASTPGPLTELDRPSPALGSVIPRISHPLSTEFRGMQPLNTDSTFVSNNNTTVEEAFQTRTTDHELPVDHVMTTNDETHIHPKAPANYRDADRITSSQTTEDESSTKTGDIPIGHTVAAVEDDNPQLVSTRSLKRKRVPGPKVEIYTDIVSSDGTPARPVRVKEEPRSNSPEPISRMLERKETLDLDELGPTILLSQHHLREASSRATATLRHQRSISFPLLKEESIETDQMQLNTSAPHHGHVGNETSTDDSRAFSEPTRHKLLGRHALRPMDPNSRNENADEPAPSKKLRREVKLTPNAARARFNLKIRQGQIPFKGAQSTPRTPVAPFQRSGADLPTPPTSSGRGSSRSALPIDSPAHSRSARFVVPASRQAIDSKPQQPTPLRSKPASELRLSDFKPNPAYNQGYSYAFRETIRKRSDRACLPGCTRPECCGSAFRALAEAAPSLTGAEEAVLLEDYLGDAHDANQIEHMLPDERHELVIQARTRQMANKHGKHRQTYERAKSPPGFWRMDFPTTQEEQEDKEKALRLEREQIQERLTEAMRTGGKFVFRDE